MLGKAVELSTKVVAVPLDTARVTFPADCLKVTFNVVVLMYSTLSTNGVLTSISISSLQAVVTASILLRLKVSTSKESVKPSESVKSNEISPALPSGFPVNTR